MNRQEQYDALKLDFFQGNINETVYRNGHYELYGKSPRTICKADMVVAEAKLYATDYAKYEAYADSAEQTAKWNACDKLDNSQLPEDGKSATGTNTWVFFAAGGAVIFAAIIIYLITTHHSRVA